MLAKVRQHSTNANLCCGNIAQHIGVANAKLLNIYKYSTIPHYIQTYKNPTKKIWIGALSTGHRYKNTNS